MDLGTRPERVLAVYDGLDVQNLVACGVTPISHGAGGSVPAPWMDGRHLDTALSVPFLADELARELA